jgi:hypothetical protein
VKISWFWLFFFITFFFASFSIGVWPTLHSAARPFSFRPGFYGRSANDRRMWHSVGEREREKEKGLNQRKR